MNTELSETLLRSFTVTKYRAPWHKLGILEFALEMVASRVFESFQRNEIDFDTMTHACESIEKIEKQHAQELGIEEQDDEILYCGDLRDELGGAQ